MMQDESERRKVSNQIMRANRKDMPELYQTRKAARVIAMSLSRDRRGLCHRSRL